MLSFILACAFCYFTHPPIIREITLLRSLWSEWLRLARHIGSFNARALITLVYFTLLAPFGLIYHFFADVLHMKHPPEGSDWHEREMPDTDLKKATRQG